MTNAIRLTRQIPERALEWRNNPVIYQWCRQHAPLSIAQHNKWLTTIETDDSIKMFGIWVYPVDPKFVGVCGLTSIDRINQKAEFSLYIAPEYQEMGYGKRSLGLLLEHGFKFENLQRIWGEVFDHNPAMAMFESLGFVREGLLRKSYYRNGKFIDSHLISLLREDYQT